METFAPQDEIEVADIVRAAGKSRTFEIVSGGSKRDFGRATDTDTILNVSALRGIVAYEPDELVMTARAGTKLSEATAALRARRQMLAFAPADWGPLFGVNDGEATLGGIVASNAAGARRICAGGVRDHVIGVRFVNGAGEAIKGGGRVVKNVTGFDVPKLLSGAFGTLGVMTEITFRVVPAPEAAPVLALRPNSAEEGLRILLKAAGLPLEPTGLAYLPRALVNIPELAGGASLIRVEGSQAAVSDKLDRLKDAFAAHDPVVLEETTASAVFRDIDNCSFFRTRETDIWRLCVPASESFATVRASGATLWYADWAGGLLWLGLPATAGSAAKLRAITAKIGGHAMLMRGPAAARQVLPVFEPESPARAVLTRSVKAAFDPARILNPGRMYEDV